MSHPIIEVSALLCGLGAAIGSAQIPQRRLRRGSLGFALAFALLTLFAAATCIYLRSPFSPLRAQMLVGALCLAQAPWLFAALQLQTPGAGPAWRHWRPLLSAQLGISAVATVVAGVSGIDWVTGIGGDPIVVVTRSGLLAVAISAVPALMAVALALGSGFGTPTQGTRLLVVGFLGATGALLWVSANLLWHGYLAVIPPSAAIAVAAVSAAAWALGMHRPAAAVTLSPSRRLVYTLAAAALLVVYLLTARATITWLVRLGDFTKPAIFAVAVFCAFAGVILVGGSRRVRHGLWTTIGRYLFRSKHDYGEVWIHLTQLTSRERTVPELLRRIAALGSEVLCRPVSIWLLDSSGHLWRAAAAGEAGEPESELAVSLPAKLGPRALRSAHRRGAAGAAHRRRLRLSSLGGWPSARGAGRQQRRARRRAG